MRLSQLLRTGAISGAAAGLAAALVMWLHTEPVIRRALAIEDARAHSGGTHHHEEELVSRTAQVFFGACTAAIAGLLFGLVFAVVFARTRHRLPGLTDQIRAMWLGVLGFAAFTLMPALAIPSNPPAVGDPATVTQRTVIYVLTVLVGLLIIGAVSSIDHVLSSRHVTPPVRLVCDLVGATVLVVVALWLLPASPDRIPADVPAEVIWDFRVASLAQLSTMWFVLASLFGLLVSRRTGVSREADPVLMS